MNNQEIRNFFATDFNIPENRSHAFDLNSCTSEVNSKYAENLTPQQIATLIFNLESPEVVGELAKGRYVVLDPFDQTLYNDSYEDMMDDLGF